VSKPNVVGQHSRNFAFLKELTTETKSVFPNLETRAETIASDKQG